MIIVATGLIVYRGISIDIVRADEAKRRPLPQLTRAVESRVWVIQ